MAEHRLHRRRLLALAAAAFALPLPGACGRKGPITSPEGEEANYTWPRTYPDPATQVPPLAENVAAPPKPVLPGGGFGQERTVTRIIQ